MVTMSFAPPARGVSVLEVTGCFDAHAVAVLRTGLVDALGTQGPRLVLDLRAVGIDVAGMQAIGDAAMRASRRGGWLRVVAEPTAGVPKAFANVPDAVAAR